MTESSRIRARASAVAAFERTVAAWAAGTGPAPRPTEVPAAILVEGRSDRAAVLAAAHLLGIDRAAEGLAVLPMGGAMSVRRFADLLGPTGAGLALRGLCDAGEARFFQRAGLDANVTGICRPDLEGELLRALGQQQAEDLLEREGDLRLFRIFQRQPAQRDQPASRQLHRFLGTTAGRKERYGRILTAALTPGTIPVPVRVALGAGDR